MTAVTKPLTGDVVRRVMGPPGREPATTANPAPAPAEPPCGCGSKRRGGAQGRFGVFQNANEACEAAQAAFLQLQQKGVAARRQAVEIVKAMADANAAEWGRLELEETGIGRLDHKIEKLKIIKLVPGVEWLHPDGLTGDHGITLQEYTP